MSDHRARLNRYLDELDTWNRRLNLTAVPRAAAWQRHVEETLELLAVAGIPADRRCIDIGSGGGVPGIVVAVVRPDLHLTLVDSDRRKCGFLVHVSGMLGLGNVIVVARRAEDLARDPEHHQRYDVALSRATAPPPLLCTLALPLLRPEGTLWALVRDADAAARAVSAVVAAAGAAASAAAPGVLRVQRGGA